MKRCGLEPDPWQMELLRSRAQRALLLCTRQAGKSTVTALYALHAALYEPPALVLLLSPSLRQSGELFQKVAAFYRSLAAAAVTAEHQSALRLELVNGSRIISLPGKEETIRGYSGVRLLVVDEAARVPDELYYSIRPMLAVSRGRLIALSTPFGKRGWFFEAWHSDPAHAEPALSADMQGRARLKGPPAAGGNVLATGNGGGAQGSAPRSTAEDAEDKGARASASLSALCGEPVTRQRPCMWQRTKVTAYECPRISREFLEEERASMPAGWFAAEYLCEFNDLEGGVFTYEQVEGAVAEIEPLFGIGRRKSWLSST